MVQLTKQIVNKLCMKYFVIAILFISLGNASDGSNTNALENNIDWNCANNATCVNLVKKQFLDNLQNRKAVNIAGISIEPTGEEKAPIESGRGFMSNIFSDNAIKIPFGGLIVSLQRSADHKDCIEVALEESAVQARRRGGFGGGGGIGGGGGRRKKYMQSFIPIFLAFNAVGWMLLAVKAVAVLVVKAVLVSKIALLVAGSVVFKKLMDTATEKFAAPPHPFDHAGEHAFLPYSMDYALPSHNYHTTAELNGGDLFSVPISSGQESLGPHSLGLGGGEAIASESQISQVVANLNNATKGQTVVSVQSVPKVKRQDEVWTGYKRPMFYNPMNTANPVYFYNKA